MAKASFVHRLLLAAALGGFSGCTISQTPAPSLYGPSEFGVGFNLTALPDQIVQDGTSQSRIVVSAYSPNGVPRPGVSFRLDQAIDGQIVDFDTLSTKTVTTGADGTASVIFTSPVPPPTSSGPVATCSTSGELPGHRVKIFATPIGTDFATHDIVLDNTLVSHSVRTQDVQIRLIPPPPVPYTPTAGGPSAPTASFVYSPLLPTVGEEIQFLADGSRAASGRRIVGYAWNWGDGSFGRNDPHEDHDYASACTYPVTLTVTDDAGQTSSIMQMIAIH